MKKLTEYWKGFLQASFIALVIAFLYFHFSPKWGKNIESANWMPEGASKGAYAHGGSFFVFGPPVFYKEYDISEPDMINYLEEKGWEYNEIKEPRTQKRYLSFFCVHPERAGVDEDYIYVTVSNGLYHDSYRGDSGRRILYDREKGRAYYRFDSR